MFRENIVPRQFSFSINLFEHYVEKDSNTLALRFRQNVFKQDLSKFFQCKQLISILLVEAECSVNVLGHQVVA